VPGGTVVWTQTADAPLPGAGTLGLGPVAATPSGVVLVSDFKQGPGGEEPVGIIELSLTGAYAGSLGVPITAGNGGNPVEFLGSDPSNHVLFSYFGQGALSSEADAYEATLSGTYVKTVDEPFAPISATSIQFTGLEGDSAGHLAIHAYIQQGSFDFGKGPETGSLILRYDAAGSYLGSIPDRGGTGLSPGGDFYVLAPLQGTMNLGCGPVTAPSSPSTIFASLDFNGNCLWNKVLSSPLPSSWVVDAQSILLAVSSTSAVDLGGGPLPAGLTLARFDLSGKLAAGSARAPRAVPAGSLA
jgi:hypothetical protein